jgi:WD40 repeat protein
MADVRSSLERLRSSVAPPELPLERVLARHDRIQRNRRIRAGVAAGAIVLVGIAFLIRAVALERDDVPAGPVGNGAIVVRDGGRLIAMGSDGSRPVTLTDDPVVAERCPSEAACIADAPYVWSSDGELLAFVAGPSAGPRFLYTVAAGGGTPRLIAPCEGRCDIAWAPIGHRLASTTSDSVTVIDVDTGQQTAIALAPCAGSCVISPPAPRRLAWSLDGSQIASAGDDGSLTVSASDGSASRMLIGSRPGDSDHLLDDIAWRADATIVFSTIGESSDERDGIWALDPDTGATTQLIDVGLRSSIIGLQVAPGGSLIWSQAEGRCPNPGCPFGVSIWRAEADGSEPRELDDAGCCTAPNTENVFTGPVISPDGTQLVFTVIYDRERAAESGVYVMTLDGTDARRISMAGTSPAWQPVPGDQ